MNIDEQFSKSFSTAVCRTSLGKKFADFCAVQMLWLLLGIYFIVSYDLGKSILPVVIAWGVTLALEYLIRRPRPFQKDGKQSGVEMLWVPPSFPSAHATIGFSAVTSLSVLRPDLFVLCLVLAILVSLGRVAVRVHYFTDVIAGAIVGVAVTSLLL